MDFGLRSMSYNAVSQFQRRRKDDSTLFGGKGPLRKSAEEEREEEERLKKGEFKPHKLPLPGFHIIA